MSGSVFETKLQVRSWEVGPDLLVKPSIYLQWLQEASLLALEGLGFTLREWSRRERFWVYAGYRLQWLGTARAGDRVAIRTWVSKFEAARAYREFEVSTAGGQPLLFAQAEHVFVAVPTLEPKRIDPDIVAAFGEGDSHFGARKRLKPPAGAVPSASVRRTVQHDEIDLSGHVNNAVYLRWATDALLGQGRPNAADNPAAHFSAAALRYRLPLRLGDEFAVAIYGGASAGEWEISVTRADGVLSACARLTAAAGH